MCCCVHNICKRSRNRGIYNGECESSNYQITFIDNYFPLEIKAHINIYKRTNSSDIHFFSQDKL